MERKLVFASLEDDYAIMRLDKRIGPDPNNPNASYIDGSYFADEMSYLYKIGKKIQVRINTIGGNVIQGWSIYDAVTLCQADTHCYGLAASMGGIILLAGKKRTADAHASAMLHGAHDEDGDTKNPFIQKVNAAFKILLESRTSLSAERIDQILKKGDHYFDASDMREAGMIDKDPIPSKIKIAKKANASVEELVNIYASLENQNTMEMPAWIAAIFKGKTEAENMAAALKLSGEKAAADAKVAELEKEIAALKLEKTNASLAEVKTKAKALIESAKASKKLTITAEQEAQLITAAENNFAAFELMINSMGSAKRESVAAAIGKTGKEGEVRMSYEEMATKHPEALTALAEENPELFDQLLDEHIQEKSKGKK